MHERGQIGVQAISRAIGVLRWIFPERETCPSVSLSAIGGIERSYRGSIKLFVTPACWRDHGSRNH